MERSLWNFKRLGEVENLPVCLGVQVDGPTETLLHHTGFLVDLAYVVLRVGAEEADTQL